MSTANNLGIIIARMDSSRLPGKPLLRLAGTPLLGHVIARARACRHLSRLVVATTHRTVDDPLVAYAGTLGVDAFRGEVEDVSQRVLDCAGHFHADHFVRLNGDSPFPDAELMDRGVQLMRDDVQFVTNIPGRTFPYGISVEVLDTAFYRQARTWMQTAADREHVTAALYRSLDQIVHRVMLSDHPELSRARLVVDTPADFRNIEQLILLIGPNLNQARYVDVAKRWLDCHPDTGAVQKQ